MLFPIFLLFLLIGCSIEIDIPANPCPGVFSYQKDGENFYGMLRFENDRSGRYSLTVNATLKALLRSYRTQNIQLNLKTTQDDLRAGLPVVYEMLFPLQTVLPRITAVTFNGVTYCRGLPEETIPGQAITDLYVTKIISQGADCDPCSKKPNYYKPTSMPQAGHPTPISVILPPLLMPSPNSQRPKNTSYGYPDPDIDVRLIGEDRVNGRPEQGIRNQSRRTSPNLHNRFDWDNNVPNKEFPWLVAIFQSVAGVYKFKCTGNLISSRHVLAPAHCVVSDGVQEPKESFTAVLGKEDLRNWAVKSKILALRNIEVHPNFQQHASNYDVAVLELEGPITFDSKIQSIDVSNRNEEVTGQGTLVGWKLDSLGVPVPSPRAEDVVIANKEECKRSGLIYRALMSERTFCGRGGPNGSCDGSGGSGFVQVENGRKVLKGLLTLDPEDKRLCDGLKYTVFTNLGKLYSWISSVSARVV